MLVDSKQVKKEATFCIFNSFSLCSKEQLEFLKSRGLIHIILDNLAINDAALVLVTLKTFKKALVKEIMYEVPENTSLLPTMNVQEMKKLLQNCFLFEIEEISKIAEEILENFFDQEEETQFN